MDLNLNVNVKLDATPTLIGCVRTLATAFSGTRSHELSPELIIDGPVTFVPGQPSEVETTSAAETKPWEKVETASVPEQPKEITDEQLRAIVGPKSKECGKEKVFAILDEFGVKRVPDLKQDQRQAFIEKVNAL